MELLSMEFLSALAAIVVIDLVLAGDNAIVIALAARQVPVHLRTKAIAWGTVGAIVVRSAMTLAVVWLLNIPGLMLVGGLLLVWIAYKLLADNSDGKHEVNSATSFWGAMRTIVIADAVMGLDNVLAVAGAAHGSFLLVVLGLLISIPIVIWGSQLFLSWVDRFPVIVYIGGAVLAWTAAKMIIGEPLVKGYFGGHAAFEWGVYFAVIGGVLGGGFLTNSRKVGLRVAAHLVKVEVMSVPATGRGQLKGDIEMLKVLIPIADSPNSLFAVHHVIKEFDRSVELHLLHVRTPFSRYIARFLSKRDLAAYHRDEAVKALKPARDLLDSFGVPYASHVELGDKAKTITGLARRLRVDRIVMATARKNSLTRLVEDSLTNRVLELTQVPVEVVAGNAVSRLERYGIPAGLSAAVALLFFVSAD